MEFTSNNTIGGTSGGAGNTIAFNGGAGVMVYSGVNNAILSNSIHDNDGLGIDLGHDGVTLNDDPDPDEGANHLQNFPVPTTALITADSTIIQGTFNSTANTEFRLEFFASTTADPSGYGQGEQPLGIVNVITDESGNATFTFIYALALPLGQFITATATDPNYNTSKFSAWVVVSAEPLPPNGGGSAAFHPRNHQLSDLNAYAGRLDSSLVSAVGLSESPDLAWPGAEVTRISQHVVDRPPQVLRSRSCTDTLFSTLRRPEGVLSKSVEQLTASVVNLLSANLLNAIDSRRS